MSASTLVPLIPDILKLFKSGKSPEEIASELNSLMRGYEAELQSGDGYTRRARPTLIYVCITVIVNDWIIRPYVNLFADQDIPILLTETNFKLMIALLTALGLARSVMDKQGKWMERLADRMFKK